MEQVTVHPLTRHLLVQFRKGAPQMTDRLRSRDVAQRVRLASRRSRLAKAKSPLGVCPTLTEVELEALRVMRRELQRDADMDDDPRYSALITDLLRSLDNRKLHQALYKPQDLLDEPTGYPLYPREVAELCRKLGVDVAPKTVERLARVGLIPPPTQIGEGRLVRDAYFARHVVDVLTSTANLEPERA